MPDAAAIPAQFTLRSLQPTDEPAVLELLRTTLGERDSTRKTADYWEWKHVRNPFGASYALCAEDPVTHDIAGLRVLMRWSFLDGNGTRYDAVRAVDTATHPSYQRRGIFSTLTRYAIEELRRSGVAFVFNTPNTNSLPGYLKMGWKVVERWPVLVRPVHPVRTAIAALAAGRRRAMPSPGASGLMEWPAFGERYAGQVEDVVREHEQARRRVGCRTIRTLQYLDWRYGSHPDVRYGVHALPDASGRLDGFVIARPTRGTRGLSALVLTEMFVRGPTVRSIRRLLRSAMRGSGGNYWMAHAASGTLERDALRRSGFVPAPGRGYTWTALPLLDGVQDPTRPDAWDLTLGEMEIF